MSSTLRRPTMTEDEFLAWESQQEIKYEFDGFDVIAMTGGTVEHSEIASNIWAALRRRLAGTRCRAIRGDVQFHVLSSYRYPDVIVTCSPIPLGSYFVPEPVVVFEVLSKSTAETDYVIKLQEYRAAPSIQHYVIVAQTTRMATVHTRTGTGWTTTTVERDGAVSLPAIGVDLPLAESYLGLDID